MDPVHGRLLLERRLVEAALRPEARVVDQQLEPRLGGQPRPYRVNFLQAPQVGGQDLRRDAMRTRELGSQLVQPITAARNQQQVVASRRQFAREHRSESGRCAGDRSNTVGHAALLYDLGMTVMRQSWRDVAFLHWRYDPALVRPLVPRGLEL